MPLDLDLTKLKHGTTLLKRGFAKMQKGGVIMDVTNAEQAGIAEEAGAVAVMALERVPADIRSQGGVARMADPNKIAEIIEAVTIPVMAKCRIGHFAEAQVLEFLGVDMIDESEVLTPADPFRHVDKSGFKVPFVCGATSLGEAARRIDEGAAMIRTKGEAGTGNVVEAVRHFRVINDAMRSLLEKDDHALLNYAEEIRAPYTVVKEIAELQRLPVVNFAAGGLATPADAAMMMQLGVDGVFVGSGIFKSTDPEPRAKANPFRRPRGHRRGLPGTGRCDGRHRDRVHPGQRAAAGAGLVTVSNSVGRGVLTYVRQ
jgi:pyridoxal 5'-phosphate synthase pdxS subunit